MVITGVADYGFFAQAVQLPVEGLVHISTLAGRLLLLRRGDAQSGGPARRVSLPPRRPGARGRGARGRAAAAARFSRGASAETATQTALAGGMRGGTRLALLLPPQDQAEDEEQIILAKGLMQEGGLAQAGEEGSGLGLGKAAHDDDGHFGAKQAAVPVAPRVRRGSGMCRSRKRRP